jgi:hypothetical protein
MGHRQIPGVTPAEYDRRLPQTGASSSARLPSCSVFALLAGSQPAQELAPAGAALPERQAAQILGVSTKTLRNWRWRRVGPPFVKYSQRGGPVRYILGELIAWRDAHRGNVPSAEEKAP